MASPYKAPCSSETLLEDVYVRVSALLRSSTTQKEDKVLHDLLSGVPRDEGDVGFIRIIERELSILSIAFSA
jgi:hypothetical protein